jgi:hypothetical protein
MNMICSTIDQLIRRVVGTRISSPDWMPSSSRVRPSLSARFDARLLRMTRPPRRTSRLFWLAFAAPPPDTMMTSPSGRSGGRKYKPGRIDAPTTEMRVSGRVLTVAFLR